MPTVHTIVVVDDHLPNALLLKGYVSRLRDVDVVVFTDPHAALTACMENEPDLVMLDYLMPGMDGGAFLQQFRAVPTLQDVPVIVVTVEDSKDTLYRMLECGATDFLHKPVDALELIARARNMLRLRERQLALAEANDQLYRLANTDALTGLANRRRFLERLGADLDHSVRHERPLCLAMIDCDHFKDINDTYGHDAGDKVLRSLAGTLFKTLRKGDVAGRLGGEEYAMILPETNVQGAVIACERIMHVIRGQDVEAGTHRIHYTVSLGLTDAGAPGDTVDHVLKRADMAMYEAKRAGRDRIAVLEAAKIATTPSAA